MTIVALKNQHNNCYSKGTISGCIYTTVQKLNVIVYYYYDNVSVIIGCISFMKMRLISETKLLGISICLLSN